MVLDLDGDGFAFTSKEGGVLFDLEGDSKPQQVSWTAKNSDDSFLAFDSNKNGVVEGARELVGTRLRLPDGARPTSGADARDGVGPLIGRGITTWLGLLAFAPSFTGQKLEIRPLIRALLVLDVGLHSS